MLASRRELPAAADPKDKAKYRQLGLGLTCNPAAAAPSNNQESRYRD